MDLNYSTQAFTAGDVTYTPLAPWVITTHQFALDGGGPTVVVVLGEPLQGGLHVPPLIKVLKGGSTSTKGDIFLTKP